MEEYLLDFLLVGSNPASVSMEQNNANKKNKKPNVSFWQRFKNRIPLIIRLRPKSWIFVLILVLIECIKAFKHSF